MSRWLAFAVLLAGCATLIVTLTPPYSTLAFVAMVTAAVVVSWVSATPQQRQQGFAVVRALFSARFWVLAAVVLMGLSAYHFAQGIMATGMAMWLALGGGVMVGVGILTSPPDLLSIYREGEQTPSPEFRGGVKSVGNDLTPRPPFQPRAGEKAAIRWRWLLGGVLALTLLASINGLPQEDNDKPLIGWQWYVPAQVQFALLWGGVAMLVWSVRPDSKRAAIRSASPPLQGDSLFNWEKAALLAILLLALGLRLWNLDGLIHRFIDEIHFANAVVRLQNEPNLKILLPFGGVTAFTWVFPHFEWLSAGLFGPSLASLRLPSAVMGALNVWALYWLAKALFDRKTALLAALFLATFPPHIHFSRLALNNIADPLFGTLTLGLVARALTPPPSPLPVHGEGERRRALFYWALAGVCLGLTQYFYEGGKLLFPPLVMLWVGWMAVVNALAPRLGWLLRWVRMRRADIGFASSPLVSLDEPHPYPPTLSRTQHAVSLQRGEGERIAVLSPSLRSGEGLGVGISRRYLHEASGVGKGDYYPPSLRGALLLAAMALLVAAPLYYSLAATYNLFSPRLFFTSWVTNQQTEPVATAEGFLWHTVNSVPYALTAFVQLTDASWFYSGETPLILPILVPLVLLGAAQALWRLRSPGGSLLVLWIMGTVLGNSVLSQATHYPRFVVAFPALALLLALGLRSTWAMVFEPPRREGRQGRELAAVSSQPLAVSDNPHPPAPSPLRREREQGRMPLLAKRGGVGGGDEGRRLSQQPNLFLIPHPSSLIPFLLILFSLLIAFVQTQYYFGEHMQAFFQQNRLSKDTDDALFRALDLPPDTDVMIVGKQILWSYNVDTILQFYRRTDLNVLSYAPSDFALVLRDLPLNRDYVIFIEPEDLDTARLLRERFGDIGAPQVSPYAVPMDKHYVMYWIKGREVED